MIPTSIVQLIVYEFSISLLPFVKRLLSLIVEETISIFIVVTVVNVVVVFDVDLIKDLGSN